MDVTDLNDKQRHALEQFKCDLGSATHDDRFLIKWLKARNFDVNKAKTMYTKSMAWRKRVSADNMLSWDPPEVLVKYYAGGGCGHDKEGHPVLLDMVSYLDFKGLLHSCQISDIVKYEARSIECSIESMREQTKKLGRTIDQFTVIMDMDKLGLKHLRKQYIRCYNEIITMTEDNYPEYLHRCYIINAPRIFPMIYSLIKPFLTEDTRRKVNVLGKNWKEKLLEYIDADQLPQHWGGTRTDPDGDPYCQSQICLGGEVPQSYYTAQADKNDASLATVEVSRRQHYQIGMEVTLIGSVIRWRFNTDTYEIGFGIYLTDNPKSAKLSDMKEVQPIEKVNSHIVTQDGAISCEQTGTYVMVFDNRYSMVHGITLHYNIELMRPDASEEDADDMGDKMYKIHL